jgi:hypothetical protein
MKLLDSIQNVSYVDGRASNRFKSGGIHRRLDDDDDNNVVHVLVPLPHCCPPFTMGTMARGSKRGHRDGDDEEESYSKATAAVVVVVPHNTRSTRAAAGTGNTSRWQAKLEELAGHLAQSSSSYSAEVKGENRSWSTQQAGENDSESPFGSVFASIQQWKANDGAWDEQRTVLQQSSDEMRADVQDRLDRLSQALEERSEQNYRLQLRLTELKAAHRSAIQQLEQELESQWSRRRHELSSVESELEHVQKEARELFREQGEEIPRLQHMIALYSSCTGIKWYDDDFDDDDDDQVGERGESSNSAAMMTTPDCKVDKTSTRPPLWRGEVVRRIAARSGRLATPASICFSLAYDLYCFLWSARDLTGRPRAAPAAGIRFGCRGPVPLRQQGVADHERTHRECEQGMIRLFNPYTTIDSYD